MRAVLVVAAGALATGLAGCSDELAGVEGTWTVEVDYDDVAGSGPVILWG